MERLRFNMSVHITSPCWKIACPTVGQKIILLKLADNANEAGVCWPSLSTIAKDCGCSTRTVSRAIVYFESINLLSHDRRFNSSNTYQFNIDTLSILSSGTIDTMSKPIDTMSIPIDTVSTAIDTSVPLTVSEPSKKHQGTVKEKESIHCVENLHVRLIKLLAPHALRTELNIKEGASFKKIKTPIREHDMELLEDFYGHDKSKTFNLTWKRRNDLVTILNNFEDQLDLAFEHRQQMIKSQPKISTPTVWS